ncbi:MAG: PASTA domain-containing protein [Sphingobacteriales bacterium]|nr:MAG: PASTA domain-containing protein [Sphingobacteriales bacterium]
MSKYFLNIFYASISGVALLFFTIFFLRWYTMHGESIKVPNIENKSFFEAKKILENNNLELFVIDSTFEPKKTPMSVLYQNPIEGADVKKGRKIYITLNAAAPPSVKIPEIIDNSRRQAEIILTSWGINIGNIIYTPDLAKEAVLGIRYKNQDVKPGKIIPKGSTIDLILGDGIGTVITEVPPLVGLTVLEAIAVLDAVHINVGEKIADGPIDDTMNAYIFNQDPMFGSVGKLNEGNSVKLYITSKPVDFVQP